MTVPRWEVEGVGIKAQFLALALDSGRGEGTEAEGAADDAPALQEWVGTMPTTPEERAVAGGLFYKSIHDARGYGDDDSGLKTESGRSFRFGRWRSTIATPGRSCARVKDGPTNASSRAMRAAMQYTVLSGEKP